MPLPRLAITLNQIRTFETVVRAGGVTRAAEELHVTQPAVSLQLRQLNEAVGLPVFEVVGRKVFPTEAGKLLLEAAERMFDTWADFQSAVAGLKGLKRGRLRIAAVTTAEYFIPRVLGPFSARYPGIDVSLAIDNRNAIVHRLAANVDDLYIMGMPPESLDIERAPFLSNPLVVIAPQGHALAGRSLTPAMLAGEKFVMREAGSGTRMAAERHLREQGLQPVIKWELGSNEAIKRAVASGLGISVLSEHAIGERPEREGVVVLNVRGFPIRRSWYLVYAKGRALSLVARAFLDYAMEVCARPAETKRTARGAAGRGPRARRKSPG